MLRCISLGKYIVRPCHKGRVSGLFRQQYAAISTFNALRNADISSLPITVEWQAKEKVFAKKYTEVFANRHIGPNSNDNQTMLNYIKLNVSTAVFMYLVLHGIYANEFQNMNI